MPFTSLHTLLQPQVILRVVSRIRLGQNRLGRWFGFQPTKYNPEDVALDGPNIVRGNTRYATFRTYDMTRTVAKARAPGTGPATVPMNPVGSVPVSCARFHDKIPLDYEQLGNLSPIVGPNSQIDTMGQDYMRRAVMHLARKFNMLIELMTAGMVQDSLWFNYVGDDILVTLTPIAGDNSFQIPFQIPSGNKNLLNMLGTGNIITSSWKLPTTPIIQHWMAIKAAYAILSGFSVTDMWVNSPMWYYILTNTEVRNLAGSAATPFAEFDRVDEVGADGEPTGDYEAILKADPTIHIHISDEVVVTNSDFDPVQAEGVATNAVVQKIIPDGFCYITTTPTSEWTQMYHGAEGVVENPGMPATMRSGYYFWKEYVTQPSAVDLIALLNAMPLLFVPKAIAPAQPFF